MFTVGGVCSGSAAIELAFMLAGFKVRYLVEKNPFCQRILKLRCRQFFPDAYLFKDVYGVGKHNLPAVDVVTAGFPCQPVSNAGKQLGIHDERWIWDQVARIIKETRPRAVFLENTEGLVSANDGSAFKHVLNDLTQSGYDAEWACLRADSTVGAPHERERWFCIAVDPNANGIRQHQQESATAREGVLSGEWAAETDQREREQQLYPSGRSRKVGVGYAYRQRMERQRTLRHTLASPGGDARELTGTGDERGRDDGAAQSRLGRKMLDGVTCGLDESGNYRYWANYLNQPQYDYEPARVTAASAFREDRVEAVGNGVVMPLIYKLACVVREKITSR